MVVINPVAGCHCFPPSTQSSLQLLLSIIPSSGGSSNSSKTVREKHKYAVAAGRESKGASAPGGTVQGRHLEGQKYGILKFYTPT